ncbi:MAG: hypothetical protein IT584_02635 [Chlamydiae bacterium]|nr:hypothetical protein [Chlamydiota bacterium]
MEERIKKLVFDYAKKYKGLYFLLLFGSQAQAQARPESDWDFGYLADRGFDSMPLYTDLVLILESNQVDLVDLNRANGLLRYRAVKDGLLLFEAQKGEYEKFWLEVLNFWCDVSPQLQREYTFLLEGLG